MLPNLDKWFQIWNCVNQTGFVEASVCLSRKSLGGSSNGQAEPNKEQTVCLRCLRKNLTPCIKFFEEGRTHATVISGY